MKYSSVSSRGISSARPQTTTCRCWANQGKVTDAFGLACNSRDFREVKLEKNTNPRSSTPFSSTVRVLGAASASAVANTIALASVTLSSFEAAANHV